MISYAHDGAAALVSETGIVQAYEEERISRRQHSIAAFPEQSAMIALERAGLRSHDLDEIVVTSMNSCDRQGDYQSKIEFLREILLVDTKIPVTCVHHHLAHSALSVLTSSFEDCAFLTVDAGGDGLMGHCGVFKHNRFEIDEHFRLSPGILYAYITCLAGFSLFEEGKVMGLSAFGTVNDRLYTWLRRNFFISKGKAEMQTSEAVRLRWESSLVPERFDPDTPRRHKYYKLGVSFHEEGDGEWLSNIAPWDVAATGQLVFEELMLEAVHNVIEATNCTQLALSGGALQNVLLVDKLHRLNGIRVHVPVAPHDSGLVLGSGLLRIMETTGNRVACQTHPYLGPSFSVQQIEARIRAFGLPYVERPDLPIAAADEIVKGRTVGWFSGPAEFGARALGARSVLADPRIPTARARLNQTLKRRDWFMPYAPSILEDRGFEYFEDFSPSPYMNRAFRVRPGKGAEIPSALHIDGTCRAHSVNARTNPAYYELISEFDRRTGVPLVLNTSFNRHGLPMVATPDQAIQHLLEGSIDCLAIERFMVYAPSRQPDASRMLTDDCCFALDKLRFAAACVARGQVGPAEHALRGLKMDAAATSDGLKVAGAWIWRIGDDVESILNKENGSRLIELLEGR